MAEQIKSLKTGIKYKDTPIGKIPVDWEMVKLGDVCDVIGGSTPSTARKELWNGNIPFATPTDITNLRGREISDTRQKISQEGLSSCRTRLLPAGSVLLTSRATIGACAINTRPMATNQGFANLVCSEKTFNWFIFYMMTFIQSDLQKIGSGSTFKEVSKNSLKQLNVSLPPLAEQKKIAGILSAQDEATEKTDQIIEKMKEAKKGLMQKLLTRGIGHKKFKNTEIGKIPAEWSIVRLEDVAADQKHSFVDGPFGSNLKTIHYTKSGIPVIQSQSVINGVFKPVEGFFVSEEKARELERSKALPGDIVIAKIGVNYGASATIPQYYPRAVLSGNTMKITPNPNNINTAFLQYLLHYFWEARVFDKIVSITAQPAITLEGAKNLKIPLPPLAEQKEIAGILSTMDGRIEKELKRKEYLTSLKNGLMQVLLTGKIRVKT